MAANSGQDMSGFAKTECRVTSSSLEEQFILFLSILQASLRGIQTDSAQLTSVGILPVHSPGTRAS